MSRTLTLVLSLSFLLLTSSSIFAQTATTTTAVKPTGIGHRTLRREIRGAAAAVKQTIVTDGEKTRKEDKASTESLQKQLSDANQKVTDLTAQVATANKAAAEERAVNEITRTRLLTLLVITVILMVMMVVSNIFGKGRDQKNSTTLPQPQTIPESPQPLPENLRPAPSPLAPNGKFESHMVMPSSDRRTIGFYTEEDGTRKHAVLHSTGSKRYPRSGLHFVEIISLNGMVEEFEGGAGIGNVYVAIRKDTWVEMSRYEASKPRAVEMEEAAA